MSSDEVSNNIRQFVSQGIDSIEQLLVLLLLHNNPGRTWSILEITHELRSTESSIEKRLKNLYSRNILVIEPELNGRHRFSPSTGQIEQTVSELANFYITHPYRVIELIYSRPTDAIRSFAEAFRFRKD